MKRYTLFVLLTLASLLLGACAQAGQPTAEPTVGLATLRIAVLPIMDALPMFVAQQEGLFENHGLQVEFIPAASAAERDQLIVAGQADGMINEVVSTIFYNKDSVQVQIVRFARIATPDSAQFHIIASGQSGITTVEGLKGVEIGISQGTVIEYLTDRLLAAEGLAADEIKTIAVPKISDRMSLLGSGELQAAMLPDPLSFLAVQQGAVIVLDDSTHPEYAYSTISFRKAVIDAQPQAIRAFLAAIEEATLLINADPTRWSSLLSEQKLVPEPLMGNYQVPPFPPAGVPTQAQWDDVLAWMQDEGLITVNVSYSDSVNPSLLP